MMKTTRKCAAACPLGGPPQRLLIIFSRSDPRRAPRAYTAPGPLVTPASGIEKGSGAFPCSCGETKRLSDAAYFLSGRREGALGRFFVLMPFFTKAPEHFSESTSSLANSPERFCRQRVGSSGRPEAFLPNHWRARDTGDIPFRPGVPDAPAVAQPCARVRAGASLRPSGRCSAGEFRALPTKATGAL